MKRGIVLLAVVVLVWCATGCGSRRDPFAVGVDLYHGEIWPGFTNQLERLGLNGRSVTTATDAQSLAGLRVLVLVVGDEEGSRELSEREAERIERFVRSGGGLLCAGAAATWTASRTNPRSLESFPLNVIGRRLGFEVMDRTVLPPRNLSPTLLSGVNAVNRSYWWASEIRVGEGRGEPLITDEALKPMAMALTHGSGRVVVVGHPALLEENPDIVRNVLIYLLGIDEDRL